MTAFVRKGLTSIVPPADAVRSARPGRFPLMDAVRAIAAFLIFVYHVGVRLEPSGWASDVVNALTIGVPIFFVVSGFLLYRPFALAHLRGDTAPRTAPYAWRRFLRIVPAFWVALTAFVLFAREKETAEQLLALYGFAQVYDPALLQDGIGQAWSLDCEVVYYALLPLTALAARSMAGPDRSSRLRWEIAGLATLLLLSEAYKLWFHSFGDLSSPRDQVFAFHPAWNLDLFVLGMVVALWSAWREVNGDNRPLVRLTGLCWLGALACFLGAVAMTDSFRESGEHEVLHALRGACAVLVVLPAIASVADGAVARRLLSMRWLLAAGVVSYGFYLYHQMVLAVVLDLRDGREQNLLLDAGLVAVSLAGAVVASVVSWVVVERPALALRRIADRPRSAA